MSQPQLSVIIPCYNEGPHIRRMVEDVMQAPLNKEVLVVDGGSTDETATLLEELKSRYPNLRVLHNPKRFVSHALNLGLQAAQGEYIARMDVHAAYPPHYLEHCLQQIQTHPADNVGGYVIFKGFTATGRAIAAALSTTWGIGYKIHDAFRFDHYTDTVHFGFWHRSAFVRFGMFDEELLRDQDEELNYRMIQKGGKIFKSASVVTELYVRENLWQLCTQYFQYGFFKPLVIQRIGLIIRFRHLVPSIFLLYLATMPALLKSLGFLACYPLFAYLGTSIYFGFNQTCPLSVKFLTLLAFPIIHLAYGLGFIAGALHLAFVKPIIRLFRNDSVFPSPH